MFERPQRSLHRGSRQVGWMGSLICTALGHIAQVSFHRRGLEAHYIGYYVNERRADVPLERPKLSGWDKQENFRHFCGRQQSPGGASHQRGSKDPISSPLGPPWISEGRYRQRIPKIYPEAGKKKHTRFQNGVSQAPLLLFSPLPVRAIGPTLAQNMQVKHHENYYLGSPGCSLPAAIGLHSKVSMLIYPFLYVLPQLFSISLSIFHVWMQANKRHAMHRGLCITSDRASFVQGKFEVWGRASVLPTN